MSAPPSHTAAIPFGRPGVDARRGGDNVLMVSCICVTITLCLMLATPAMAHWFVVPVTFCGILSGLDAMKWIRGRFALFDPAGALGVLGCHFFFLAPLLHVHWEHWMAYVDAPLDWREWLGVMATLNLLGLFTYRFTRSISGATDGQPRSTWILDQRRFMLLLPLFLLLTGGLQAWVYAESGGIAGYVATFAETRTSGDSAFQGMGWMFMISESFPILAMMGFAVHAGRSGRRPGWFTIAVVLALFLVLKIVFGGLRGSRSNTIWGLFWAAGIVHMWLRPLSKRFVAAGLAFLVAFMYAYGFYKAGGVDGVRALQSSEERAEVAATSGRTLETAVLGDLARSDVQAFILYRLMMPDADYEYAFGRTYLGAAALLVPRAIWAERPATKIQEGTAVQYGMNTYSAGSWQSSRVYGLAGEAMLNFGPVAAPLSFIVLGLAVGAVRRRIRNLQAPDVRVLFAPFAVLCCFILLVGDSDNVLFFFAKNGAVPLVLLVTCAKRGSTTALDPVASRASSG